MLREEKPLSNFRLKEIAKKLTAFRVAVIKLHQENPQVSYKELCAPFFTRCLFLLRTIRPAFLVKVQKDVVANNSVSNISNKWLVALRKINGQRSSSVFATKQKFPAMNCLQGSAEVSADISKLILTFVNEGPAISDLRTLEVQMDLLWEEHNDELVTVGIVDTSLFG